MCNNVGEIIWDISGATNISRIIAALFVSEIFNLFSKLSSTSAQKILYFCFLFNPFRVNHHTVMFVFLFRKSYFESTKFYVFVLLSQTRRRHSYYQNNLTFGLIDFVIFYEN